MTKAASSAEPALMERSPAPRPAATAPLSVPNPPRMTLKIKTAYLKNGGTLEKAAAMANHASTRTTQLYDRRRDEVSLDEVERIVI
jgi:hypothetical protein